MFSIKGSLSVKTESDMPGSSCTKFKCCSNEKSNGRRPLALFRILVLGSLFCAAVVCGAVSYIFLRKSEENNFSDQYDAVTNQMGNSVINFLSKYHAAADQLAVISNINFPNSSDWPFVGISDFYLLDDSIVRVTGSASANAILPIVKPDQLGEFNAYAKEFLAGEEIISHHPQLYQIYNVGVWNFNAEGIPREISSGETNFPSRNLITPVINPPRSLLPLRFVLGNLHDLFEVAVAMADVLACTDGGFDNCASLSAYLIGTVYGQVAETNIYSPIFSADHGAGNRTVLGFTTVGFNWVDELQRLVVDHDTSGFHFVLSSLQQPSGETERVFSYHLSNGRVEYDGPGDSHDVTYSYMRVNVPLSLIGSNAPMSYQYLLSIYPTKEYENSFYTYTPLLTAIGFSAMIIFTSVIFFLYDYLVHENDKEKDHILRMKRDFVRFISHEIRTPLNTVSVGLQLLHEALISQADGEMVPVQDMLELTADVQSSTSTAVSVLNDLLNFDKLQAGELIIVVEPVNLWETVHTVVKSFKIPAIQKNVSLDLIFDNLVDENVTKTDLIIQGDKFKICHIVRNMLSNAIKFTNEGGSVVVRVEWSVISAADDPAKSAATKKGRLPIMAGKIVPSEFDGVGRSVVTISVADTGHGLTPEQIGMLFQDGVQFNPNQLQAGQGSGLGLYLSQAMAELHGGRMWATSDGENKGSTFHARFPVQVCTAATTIRIDDSSPAPDAHKLKSTTAFFDSARSNSSSSGFVVFSSKDTIATLKKSASRNNSLESLNISRPATVSEGRVLVVDDAASNRKIVSRILRQRGYECDEAKDGKECISVILAKGDMEYYSCILMDFEMPVLNGPDATVELRKMGLKIPIYGLTGNVMVDDIEHFLISGADHVLSKPFQVGEFSAYLAQSRA